MTFTCYGDYNVIPFTCCVNYYGITLSYNGDLLSYHIYLSCRSIVLAV